MGVLSWLETAYFLDLILDCVVRHQAIVDCGLPFYLLGPVIQHFFNFRLNVLGSNRLKTFVEPSFFGLPQHIFVCVARAGRDDRSVDVKIRHDQFVGVLLLNLSSTAGTGLLLKLISFLLFVELRNELACFKTVSYGHIQVQENQHKELIQKRSSNRLILWLLERLFDFGKRLESILGRRHYKALPFEHCFLDVELELIVVGD